MPKLYRITRIVATADLGCCVCLRKIMASNRFAKQTPKFSSLTIRACKDTHARAYANGKIIINGATDLEEARKLADIYCEMIKVSGYKTASINNYKVVNIVACVDFKRRLRLGRLVEKLLPYNRGIRYNQEMFSGMTVRMSQTTCVIFETGKCNILGAADELDIQATLLELDILADLTAL
jgi:TATA-box binding protein (TBP) (component of TFIID and TFIIIB)